MEIGSFALAWLAGALSTLSPCVLPLIPIVLGSAAQQHALGPLALTVGLSASFAAVGLFVAAFGLSLGIDSGVLRSVGAVLMLLLGLVLLVPALQERFTNGASALAGGAGNLLGRMSPEGPGGQLLLGLVLGLVWSPCAGPTLGSAIGLAAQSQTMAAATALMAVFGLGAATPMLALAYGSRQAIQTRRMGLARFAGVAKPLMGALLIAVGIAVLTGLDKRAETVLTEAMPEWLVNLTVRF